jgi:uncharacterized BrkB/YihY/UPF0761 family membrane protein
MLVIFFFASMNVVRTATAVFNEIYESESAKKRKLVSVSFTAADFVILSLITSMKPTKR